MLEHEPRWAWPGVLSVSLSLSLSLSISHCLSCSLALTASRGTLCKCLINKPLSVSPPCCSGLRALTSRWRRGKNSPQKQKQQPGRNPQWQEVCCSAQKTFQGAYLDTERAADPLSLTFPLFSFQCCPSL